MVDTKKTLYEHIPHPHLPHHITQKDVHAQMRQEGGINMTVAVFLTRHVSSMYTAYSFTVLAFVGLLSILGFLPPILALLVAWLSQSFIQLVFLPILSIGQDVQGKHQEMVSEKSYYDIEQIMNHLNAQDEQILKIVQKLEGRGK